MRMLTLVALLLCGSIAVLQAQERKDTISVGNASGLSESEIRELTTPLYTPVQGEGMNSITQIPDPELPDIPALEPKAPEVPDLNINPWPRGSHLPRWATGYLYGYNAQSGSLLFGYTATAWVGVHQKLGRYWSFEGGTSLSKYSVYYNTATFHGAVTWQPNRYFSTTVFGDYTTTFLSPTPYMYDFNWGGYITLQTDTDLPFGIDAGASDHYDPLYGHFVTPIVKPFVKIGNSKVGIDFGPVIQDAILRSNHGNHEGNGFNPIPKPVKSMPRVAPKK